MRMTKEMIKEKMRKNEKLVLFGAGSQNHFWWNWDITTFEIEEKNSGIQIKQDGEIRHENSYVQLSLFWLYYEDFELFDNKKEAEEALKNLKIEREAVRKAVFRV